MGRVLHVLDEFVVLVDWDPEPEVFRGWRSAKNLGLAIEAGSDTAVCLLGGEAARARGYEPGEAESDYGVLPARRIPDGRRPPARSREHRTHRSHAAARARYGSRCGEEQIGVWLMALYIDCLPAPWLRVGRPPQNGNGQPDSRCLKAKRGWAARSLGASS